MSKNKVFSEEYFSLQLENVGAIKVTKVENVSQRNLVYVSDISIGLVLAAFALDEFPHQEVLSWIRKGRRLSDILSEQFILYRKLAKYLMTNVMLKGKGIEKWKSVLDSPYVWPTNGDENDWCKLFGYVPDICHDIVDILKTVDVAPIDKSKNPGQIIKVEQVSPSSLGDDVRSKAPVTPKRNIEVKSEFSKKQKLNSTEKKNVVKNISTLQEDTINKVSSNNVSQKEDQDIVQHISGKSYYCTACHTKIQFIANVQEHMKCKSHQYKLENLPPISKRICWCFNQEYGCKKGLACVYLHRCNKCNGEHTRLECTEFISSDTTYCEYHKKKGSHSTEQCTDPLGRKRVVNMPTEDGWNEQSQQEIKSLDVKAWFFTNINEAEAERSLLASSNDHGAFLIRISDKRKHEFVLSVHDGDKVNHYRIRVLLSGGYFIRRKDSKDPFNSLHDLVDFYTRDSNGLCTRLQKPCSKVDQGKVINKDSEVDSTSKEKNESMPEKENSKLSEQESMSSKDDSNLNEQENVPKKKKHSVTGQDSQAAIPPKGEFDHSFLFEEADDDEL